jgi:hypothetical protein
MIEKKPKLMKNVLIGNGQGKNFWSISALTRVCERTRYNWAKKQFLKPMTILDYFHFDKFSRSETSAREHLKIKIQRFLICFLLSQI